MIRLLLIAMAIGSMTLSADAPTDLEVYARELGHAVRVALAQQPSQSTTLLLPLVQETATTTDVGPYALENPVTVVTVASRKRNAGTFTFDATQGVPAGTDRATFQLTVDLADKLATGKTLSWQFFFSADGGVNFTFVNGGTWQSYGPGGLTVIDPITGQTVTNPDPYLVVPLTGRDGQILRGSLTLNQQTTLGCVITVQ